MYAIKFEADVHNGMIELPEEYKILESQRAEIILLFEDKIFETLGKKEFFEENE